jgi:hypothetical protein
VPRWKRRKSPPGGGVGAPMIARLEPYRPRCRAGIGTLAASHQVAGRVAGPEPSAPLWILLPAHYRERCPLRSTTGPAAGGRGQYRTPPILRKPSAWRQQMIGMTDKPGQLRRKAMRDIRDAVAAGNFIAIPRALPAMKRLWPQDPGLQGRREREAKLFEEGLKQLPRAVSCPGHGTSCHDR